MDGARPGTRCFADRAVEQLRQWPALTESSVRGRAGAVFTAGRRQVVHLHRPDEAELRLTRPVIERLRRALACRTRVRVMPGSDWVRLPLECESDVALLAALVSVAIKASRAGSSR